MSASGLSRFLGSVGLAGLDGSGQQIGLRGIAGLAHYLLQRPHGLAGRGQAVFHAGAQGLRCHWHVFQHVLDVVLHACPLGLHIAQLCLTMAVPLLARWLAIWYSS